MKLSVALLGLLILTAGSGQRSEGGTPKADSGPESPALTASGTSDSPRSGGAAGREARYRQGPSRFKQFRQEVRALGEEIRNNLERIGELEAGLADLPEGVERILAENRLADLRRRRAELRLELARKKLAFTIRMLESVEARYRKARAELDEVEATVVEEYPDLATLPPVE